MQGQRVEDLGPERVGSLPRGDAALGPLMCSPKAAGFPPPGPKGKTGGSDTRWRSLGLRGLDTTVSVLGVLGAAHSSARVAAHRSDGWAVPAPTAGPRC